MTGIRFTFQDKPWLLLPNGSISALSGSNEVPDQGTWSSDLSANNLLLTIGARPSISVPVKYSFTEDDNQLTVVIPGGGPDGKSDSAPCALPGHIAVGDRSELRYTLLREAANPDDLPVPVTNAAGDTMVLFVHGALHIDDAHAHLVITFPDQTTTQITASAPDGSSVNAGPHTTARPGEPADKLSFSAVTNNTFPSGAQTDTAAIDFLGSWNVSANDLVFELSGAGTEQAALKVGGVYKGVAVGLTVTPAGGEDAVAFDIKGSHRFQRPDGGSTDTNWSVELGHSRRQLDAVVKLDLAGAPAKAGDNSFQLNGTLRFTKSDTGHPGQSAQDGVALELQGKYVTRNDGQLIFTAEAADGPNGGSYNLGLEGKYTVLGGKVTFDVILGSHDSDSTASIDLGYMSKDGNLSAHMNAVLKHHQVSYDFTLRMHSENGILVPAGPPVPIAASAPAGAHAPGAA